MTNSPPLPDFDLDCRGQQCPGPVLALARAVAELDDGVFLRVFADDPAFPQDVRAWSRTANAELVGFTEREDCYEAMIRIGALTTLDVDPEPEPEPEPEPPPAKASRATLVYGEGQSAAPRSTPGSAAASAPTLPASPLGFELAPRPETHALATREATRERPASERCTLLVLHNDHEALLAALLVANGAASQGMDTNVFFTFWGLNLLRGDTPNIMEPEERVGFLQRMMKWMMPRGPKRQPLGQMHFGGVGKGMLGSIMKRQNIMMLPDLMRTAQELGVRFTACTMSMSVMGITRRELYPYPNLEYGGVASFVADARESAINLVF